MNESHRSRRAARAAQERRAPAPTATPGSRILAAALAVGIAIASLLPWWNAEPPLSRAIDQLSLWQLLLVGLSIGDLGHATQFSVVGNALFGLFSTLPTVLLLVGLVVRAIRPAAVLGKHIRLLGVSSLIGTLWLFLFAYMRTDAANGQPLILVGPWLVLLPAIAATVFGHLWWQQEKLRFPKRVRGGRASTEDEDTIDGLAGLGFTRDEERLDTPSRTAAQPALDLGVDDADEDEDSDRATIAIDTLREDEPGDQPQQSRRASRRR